MAAAVTLDVERKRGTPAFQGFLPTLGETLFGSLEWFWERTGPSIMPFRKGSRRIRKVSEKGH